MELAHLTGDRQNVSLDFTWRESKFGSSMVELTHLTGDRTNVSLDFTWRGPTDVDVNNGCFL